MSSIQALLIQGVRGFGPTDEQKAVIKFNSPLTLITGQNGAGKTTVIECLKYITTGQLPPNSSGGGFVHDPKLIGEREVRAVVKLKFKDITGTMVTCHRMLASTQKARKIEQKTVDSSMEKTNKSGEKKKITSRCGEIDKEMVAHLGVSRAILNTVVFCHQEESTWPLSEGKNLKAKFDDIFASTRYTKALDNIKKFRKDQGHKCEMFETELQYLDKEKEKADELRVSLTEAETKVASCKTEIMKIKNELEPNDERLQALNDMYEQFTTMERKIAELESSKSVLVKSEQELKRKVVSPFTGTRSELQLTIDRHTSQLERSTRRLEELEGRHLLLCEEEDEVKGQLSRQHQEHGKLETEDKYHQQRIKSRDTQITTMAASLSIPGYTEGPYSNTAVKSFVSKIAKHRQGKEDTAKREKQSFLEREQRLQEQLNELRTNLAQLTESKRMKESSIQENKRHVAEIKRELSAIGMGGAALEEIERQLQTANEELTEYRGGTDLPALEEAVSSLREEKKKMDDKVQTLQGELSRISQQSSARGALEALKNQKRTQEENYQNEMSGLETDLLALLGVMPGPEEDLERKLSNLERTKKAELKKWEEQRRCDSSQLSRLEAQKEGLIKQVSERKSRAEQLQREVTEVIGEGSVPFEEAKTQVDKDIEKKMEDISTVRGSQSFFKKSLEKIHEKRVCPACARGFDNQEAFEHTIKVLSDRLNKSIPTLLPVMNREVQQLQEKQRKLIELRPKMEELSSLQSSRIPSLEKSLSEKNEALTSLQTSSSKARGEQTRLQGELDTLRALQPRVGKVAHVKNSLEELDRRISSESSRIGVGGAMRSHVMVNRDLQEAQRSADDMNRKLDHKRQEISEAQQALRELEDRVHTLKEEKLKLQARLQKREQLVAKKNELTAQIETLDREIKTLAHQLGPVEERLSKLTNEKREIAEEREEVLTVSRAEIESLKSEEDNLKANTATITRYIEQGRDKALTQCREKLVELQTLYEKKGGQKKEVEEQKQTLQKELANAKVKERELEDNMKLITYCEEIGDKETEISRLKTRLRSMGLEQCDEEYRQCQEKSERLRKKKAHLEGQCEGREGELRNLRRQLDSDMYKNIEKRHRDKLIDLKTTEAAIADQEKYYKALDRAIMRFHTLKMEEINKILKELWIKTYKGGDIETIEIRSEDSTNGGATLGQRRVYNYRVVMIKGQTALDMRGRCSAGQKMLASILIRLALAETFCLNCGLLALDEPTTNLDHDNVEGLARSLIDIVKNRSKSQKNFQLIIITHDEDFIELLGQAGFTDCFFKVRKDVGECSRISREFFRGASHTH